MIDLSLYLVYYLIEPIEFNILGKQHKYILWVCFFLSPSKKHNTICPSDLANAGPGKLDFSWNFSSGHLYIFSQRSIIKKLIWYEIFKKCLSASNVLHIYTSYSIFG